MSIGKLNSSFVYINSILFAQFITCGISYLQITYALKISELNALYFIAPVVTGVILGALMARSIALTYKTKKIAVRDLLTQSFNHTYYKNKMNNWCEEKVDFSLILIDADNFKSINYTYGHKTGDDVLIKFTEFMNKTKRIYDVFARHSGGTFVLMVPRCDLALAARLALRLRSQIAKSSMPSEIHLTCSFGVAQFRPDSDTPDTLFERAEKALLKSKSHGKNRVVIEQPEIVKTEIEAEAELEVAAAS